MKLADKAYPGKAGIHGHLLSYDKKSSQRILDTY